MEVVIIVFILIYSIILHEVSHGVVALLNGDTTARDAGRLTLNPLPHIDIMGSVVLPGILLLTRSPFLFGWAKPVPFNPMNFRDRQVGLFTVGIAGPLTNVALAFGFAAALHFAGDNAISPFLLYGVSINVFLALFNLIPIPPLDGSRALMVFLPPNLRRGYLKLEPFGFFIILALLVSGALNFVLAPAYETFVKILLGKI